MKKLSIGLAVFFATVLVSTLFNSCKLKPELVVEAADGTGSPQDNLSFPVFNLKSLEYSDIQEMMAARVMDDVLLVIDPDNLQFTAYGIGIDNIEFMRISTSGNRLLFVSRLSTGQYRLSAWSVWDQQWYIDETFDGDIADVDWHPEDDDILVVGKMDTSTTNSVYKINSYGRIWDATSTLIDIPFGYYLSGDGITEIDCGDYSGSICFAVELDYRSGSTTPSRFALTRYALDYRWKETLTWNYDAPYSALEISGSDENLIYRKDGELYYRDPDGARSYQLSNSAVLYAGSGRTEYDIDLDDRYIYSVLPNSKSFLKYDLLNDYGTNLSLGIDEAIDIRDLQFVK